MSDKAESSFVAAAVVFAALVGYTFAPQTRFVDPGIFAVAGAFAGLSAGGLWASRGSSWGRTYEMVNMALGVAAVTVLGSQCNRAINRSQQNDERCWVLQRDMLSAAPQRTDDAAIFQALGCQPKDAMQISFPANPAALLKRIPKSTH